MQVELDQHTDNNPWAASKWKMSQEYYYWQTQCHQIRVTVRGSEDLYILQHVLSPAYIPALMSNKKRLFACAGFFISLPLDPNA